MRRIKWQIFRNEFHHQDIASNDFRKTIHKTNNIVIGSPNLTITTNELITVDLMDWLDPVVDEDIVASNAFSSPPMLVVVVQESAKNTNFPFFFLVLLRPTFLGEHQAAQELVTSPGVTDLF